MKPAGNHNTKRIKITLTDGSVIDGVRHEHGENIYYSDMMGNIIDNIYNISSAEEVKNA